MFPLDRKQLDDLRVEDLEALCQLDSEGLLLGINEQFVEYKARLLKVFNDIAYINSEINTKSSVCIHNKIKVSAENQVPEDKYAAPNLTLIRNYGFQIRWITSFFYRNTGFLAGAYTLTFESGLSCILINRNFKNKCKWLIYSLQEIITHELCHAARAPIKDNNLEEFFAYSLSTNPIRRHIGNCFRNPLDSILLLLPILLLVFVQFYKTYSCDDLNCVFFWACIFVYPLFLFIRNQISVNIYKKARNYLAESEFSPKNISAMLFRCSSDEIKKIAGFYNAPSKAKEWFCKKISTDLRWKIISKRFFPPNNNSVNWIK